MTWHNLCYSRLLRTIEVSMWGNIAVEETVDVTHKGAQLKVNKCSSEQR